jgi:hypothetical protein
MNFDAIKITSFLAPRVPTEGKKMSAAVTSTPTSTSTASTAANLPLTVTVPPAVNEPICAIVIGMAGAGKTSVIQVMN